MSDGVVMLVQGDKEKRIDYLLRVLKSYMDEHGGHYIEYDDILCDGKCLYDDIVNAVEDGERES